MLDTLFFDGLYRHYGTIFSLLESQLAMQGTKHIRRNVTQQKKQNTTVEKGEVYRHYG